MYIKGIETAFRRVIPGKDRVDLPISKRYQAEIRKEFRLAGVPFIYNLEAPKTNPRDLKPKPKKREMSKEIRLAKIQKALKENEVKEVEYRQEKLNQRRLRGADELISRGLPSWIKTDLKEIPDYMMRRKSDDNDD
jgi:hypothetical protein